MPITSSHLRGREEAWLEEVWEEDADLDHPGWRQRLASSETIAHACQAPPPALTPKSHPGWRQRLASSETIACACQAPPPALTPKSSYTNIQDLWTGGWPALGWAGLGEGLKAEGRDPSLSEAFPSPQEASSPAPIQGHDCVLRTTS